MKKFQSIVSASKFRKDKCLQNGSEILLANRKYLVGSDEDNFPTTMSYASDMDLDVFTLTNEKEDFKDLSSNISEIIKGNIDRKGAILFKGLSKFICDNQQFSKVADQLGDKFSYTAGFATREEFGDAPGVMSASDDPPEVSMEPHLEMSYNKSMPGRIMFYCHQAPQPWEGGQTPICDMRKVYQELLNHSDILQPLLDEGVRYYRTLPSRHTSQGALYSWEKTFFTEDKASVESTLVGLGYEMEWTGDGALRYSYLAGCVRHHPRSGEMVWTNQSSVCHGSYYLHLPITLYQEEQFAPSHTGHVDGRPLTRQELALIRKVQWEQCRAIAWEEGDLLVLDNHAVAHGRMGFDPQSSRSLVVALAK
eukprot:GFUD01039099.1.p1 GENE.GFUD01039099.1~~GFUD01039099.1.p1  ORF type:complete len:365 (-),score=111.07 GFUD01039099.1:45-1139(-)